MNKSDTRLKGGIVLIELCEMSRVSRYGTGMKVVHFDHNKERRLAITSRISSCDLVIYAFHGSINIHITISYH